MTPAREILPTLTDLPDVPTPKLFNRIAIAILHFVPLQYWLSKGLA
jgi:hypothetical protein